MCVYVFGYTVSSDSSLESRGRNFSPLFPCTSVGNPTVHHFPAGAAFGNPTVLPPSPSPLHALPPDTPRPLLPPGPSTCCSFFCRTQAAGGYATLTQGTGTLQVPGRWYSLPCPSRKSTLGHPCVRRLSVLVVNPWYYRVVG